MTLFSTLIPKRNNKILVCSAKRSKEAAAKQTFTLTGANRQNLRENDEMTLFSTLIPKRNNKILVCSAKRSKEAAAKQTFTLTGANRQNLRVRSTASAQRLDFGGVDVFAHARQRLSRIFCDTKQTFTLTGANRQNLRVRSTASAQRLDFGGVDVFAHARQRLSRIFCDTSQIRCKIHKIGGLTFFPTLLQ